MIAAIHTIANVRRNQDALIGRTDLDSHADQCVVGSNCLVMHDYECPVLIQGYDPNGSMTDSLRTVSAALAYESPDTGETIILVVRQALHLPSLPHNLLSPMQLQLNDVKVNDVPKFLTDQLTAYDHAIVATDDNEDELLIPLSLEGVVSIFWTHKPMIQEYESCPHFELTSDTPEYDPTDLSYAQQEEAMSAWVARLAQTGDGAPV